MVIPWVLFEIGFEMTETTLLECQKFRVEPFCWSCVKLHVKYVFAIQSMLHENARYLASNARVTNKKGFDTTSPQRVLYCLLMIWNHCLLAENYHPIQETMRSLVMFVMKEEFSFVVIFAHMYSILLVYILPWPNGQRITGYVLYACKISQANIQLISSFGVKSKKLLNILLTYHHWIFHWLQLLCTPTYLLAFLLLLLLLLDISSYLHLCQSPRLCLCPNSITNATLRLSKDYHI